MNSFIEILNQWGENFLSFSWPMLWQSSLLIAALFAFDLLFRRRLRASIRYALWLVVLVKLCVPPTLALPTSPAWWLHKTPPAVAAKPAPHFTVTYDNTPLPEMPQAPLPVFVPPKPAMANAAWLLVASAVVSMVLFGWMLMRWWQITRQVRRAATSERLTALADEAQKSLGMKFKVRVKLTTNSMSPAVCGLFRPAILIPQSLAENFSDEQLRAVLLHELIHLRRRDVWVNFLQALLQIFYWWHPLLWIANARIRRVREEAVDDAVMLALRDEAESYAPTLLEVAKLALNRPLASLGLVGIMESRHALRQRIERLVDFRAPRHAGLTLVSLLGILAFTAVAVPMAEGPALAENETAPAPIIAMPPVAMQNTNLPSVLITAQIYQMRAAEFDKIISGLKFNEAGSNGDSWWSASPAKFRELTDTLKTSSLQPITRPRILTSSGRPAQMYVGDGTNGIEFDCTPLVDGALIALTLQGKIVDSTGNDAATNLFSAKTSAENYGGIVIRTKNIGGSGESNVVVVTGVQLVTNLLTGSRPATKASIGATNVMGILNDPNFREKLHATERQNGFNSLIEPKPVITTTSGRGISRISADDFSAAAANAISAISNQSPATNVFAAKMKAKGLVQDGKLLFEMGKLDEAEVKLKAALALEPENATAKFYLGAVQTVRQTSKWGITKPERQNIVKKLDRIRLARVSFEHATLEEVVRQLNEATEKSDPEKIGVSFFIATNSVSTDLRDVNSISVTLNLNDMRLADILDVIVMVADKPVKYSIQDYGIVFSAKSSADSELITRTFKVDKNTFYSGLKQTAGADARTATNSSATVSALARKLFISLGVDLQSPPGKQVFYNDRLGELYVKATAADLDFIEKAVQTLNQTAPQIHIKARFVEAPKGFMSGVNFFSGQTNNSGGGLKGILSSTNAKAVLRTLSARKDFETLAEPEVVTTSGRQCQMHVTEVFTIITNFVFQEMVTNSAFGSFLPQTETIETGSILDVVPYALADGYTINLTVIPSLTEFLGYDSTTNTTPTYNKKGERIELPRILPNIRKQQLVATFNLWDGQTAILGGMTKKNVINTKVPLLGDVPVISKLFRSKRTTESDIIVFITATLVDPAGNRVHADDEIPFSQTAIPPQPSHPK